MLKKFIFLFLIVIVSGCSVFQSSRQIDMSPFSDNAATMFGEAVKISRPFQWKYLKCLRNSRRKKNIHSLIRSAAHQGACAGGLHGDIEAQTEPAERAQSSFGRTEEQPALHREPPLPDRGVHRVQRRDQLG